MELQPESSPAQKSEFPIPAATPKEKHRQSHSFHGEPESLDRRATPAGRADYASAVEKNKKLWRQRFTTRTLSVELSQTSLYSSSLSNY
jgi:hypothetical protein